MNAVTIFRAPEYRKAEKFARLCDFLRSKGDNVASWFVNGILIDNIHTPELSRKEVMDLLDVMESMEMAQFGEYFLNKLLESYGQDAKDWQESKR